MKEIEKKFDRCCEKIKLVVVEGKESIYYTLKVFFFTFLMIFVTHSVLSLQQGAHGGIRTDWLKESTFFACIISLLVSLFCILYRGIRGNAESINNKIP